MSRDQETERQILGQHQHRGRLAMCSLGRRTTLLSAPMYAPPYRKRSPPRGDNGPPSKRRREVPHGCTVWLGNLPWDVSERDIAAAFHSYALIDAQGGPPRVSALYAWPLPPWLLPRLHLAPFVSLSLLTSIIVVARYQKSVCARTLRRERAKVRWPRPLCAFLGLTYLRLWFPRVLRPPQRPRGGALERSAHQRPPGARRADWSRRRPSAQ